MEKTDVVKEQGKSKKLPATGFHTNPERINRKGAPEKEWTWRSLLIEAAEEIEEGSKEPKKKIMARKLIEKGLEGDTTALKEFGDRIDGKALQKTDNKHEHSGRVSLGEIIDGADDQENGESQNHHEQNGMNQEFNTMGVEESSQNYPDIPPEQDAQSESITD